MGRTASGRVRRGLLGLGVAAIGLALVLRVEPGVVPRAARDPLVDIAAALPGTLVVWTLAAGAGLYALARAARGRRDRPSPDGFVDPEPAAPDGSTPTVGSGFDRAVDAAAGAGDPLESGDEVRERLRATATATLARRTGRSTTAAREAVATGEWTDDRVAAGFLGGREAPAYPLRERIRGWILPGRAFRRRVDRTVRAVAAVAEGAAAGDESPTSARDRGETGTDRPPGSPEGSG